MLLNEVSLLFNAWKSESRECINFLADSLKTLGFLFLTVWAKVLVAEKATSSNKPNDAIFIALHIANSINWIGYQ
jgi:hypothetical protein